MATEDLTDQLDNPNPTFSETAEQIKELVPRPYLDMLLPCYHGRVLKADVTELLKMCEDGIMILRSRQPPDSFILSVIFKGKPTHHVLNRTENGFMVNKTLLKNTRNLLQVLCILQKRLPFWPVPLKGYVVNNSRAKLGFIKMPETLIAVQHQLTYGFDDLSSITEAAAGFDQEHITATPKYLDSLVASLPDTDDIPYGFGALISQLPDLNDVGHEAEDNKPAPEPVKKKGSCVVS